MIRNLMKNRATFLALIILTCLTMNTLIGQINTNSSQGPVTINPQPSSQSADSNLVVSAPPSTFPTYTGSGTPRYTQESLWRSFDVDGDVSKGSTAVSPIVIDLPGVNYWTGTRLDITLNNIIEAKDWITNGQFTNYLSSWTKYEDAGTHTGPAITIGTDLTYPSGQSTYGEAAYFRFASGSTSSSTPPQYSSAVADNTGDFGTSTHWTNATTLGGGTPHKYIIGSPPAVTPYPAGAAGNAPGGYANWQVTNLNSDSTPENRDGAWMFYVGDTEALATDEEYTVTFSTTYTFSFSDFPVSHTSFKVDYRYYSTDFDRAGNYPSASPQDFTLYYDIYTPSKTVLNQQIMTYSAQLSDDPGDSNWQTSQVYDLDSKGLWDGETAGNCTIVMKLVVNMCVDDGRTEHDVCETWCTTSYTEWTDDGNEDSDYLFFYIDALEMTVQVPKTYGADVDPTLTQTITFDRRNATYGYFIFYYYVPSTFMCGKTADNGLYLDININSQPAYTTRTSIKNILTKDAWSSLTLSWTTIMDDIGINPGPITFTVTFKIAFTTAGWYAKGSGQSIWIDMVTLYLENYASVDIAQLTCYDEEHGNTAIPWTYKSETLNSLTYYNTWQTSTTSSRFWLNTTSNSALQITSGEAKFYAANHYQLVTPTFSLPTDPDGRTDTVTWTMNFLVSTTNAGWRYNFTIPSIPSWAAADWNVVSVKDSLNGNVGFWTRPAAGSMKNISIYTPTATAAGTWVVTCTSPNKITNFNITNQNNLISYEYYPGYTNQSRIGLTTGIRRGTSSVIWVNYTTPTGTPVSGTYPDSTIQPASSYIMPYWSIATDAIANDHYIAMVKWQDMDAFNDEVGFAAHYVQVYRQVAVSSVSYQQMSTLSTSRYVVAGEQLRISVNVTDPLVSPSLALNSAKLTIDFPNKTNRLATVHKTLNLMKSDDMYYYTLETDGLLGDTWWYTEAWMGGTGNRTFTINLYGNSTYLNGVFQAYEIKGWFYLVVDTQYSLPYASTAVEQGISFTLAVELLDNVPGHNPAATGIADSEKINNRTSGTPITDFDKDGQPDTWDGRVFMRWNVIPANLTSWCAGNLEQMNNPSYQWNGTLEQKEGLNNRYEARVRVPYDAISTIPGAWYYINITTIIIDNEWGWKSEIQYMTLTTDFGANGLKSYDDHRGCFRLDVDSATGYDTQIVAYPAHTLGNPLQYNWKETSSQLTRFYLRFTNKTTSFGFNSTFLTEVDSWKVESWVVDTRIPDTFGSDIVRLQWSLVNSTLLLPDGITPDPHRENLTNSTTWGWFYSDFNWTKVDVGLGTFEEGLLPASFAMYVYAKIQNLTNPYKASETTFYVRVNPNPVNLTIALRYQGLPSFIDENYYPGQIPELKYYWGDILNFTIRAEDRLLNILTDDITMRYYIYQQGGDLATWGNLTGKSQGLYSTLFNTSDPLNTIGQGNYNVYFRGLLANRSIETIEAFTLILNRRNTQLWPINISGVFEQNSVNSYGRIEDIRKTRETRQFDPLYTMMTIPNEIITFTVRVLDASPRNYTISNVIKDANVSWYLRLLNSDESKWRLGGYSTASDENGVYTFSANLGQMVEPFNNITNEYGSVFEIQIVPYKLNFDSKEDQRYEENNPGSSWKQYVVINKRPIAIIPIDSSGTPRWDFQNSQSNWKYNPLTFVVMDLVTGTNISGCQIHYTIGTDADRSMQESVPGMPTIPGRYYVVFDTWPQTFSWVSGGQKWLEAEIILGPVLGYGTFSVEMWDIARLAGDYKVSVYVESEGFLGPLTIYFWIILGCVGAVLGGFYSYKSYKFLTTPYVIRKIEESIDKISKDKKIAAGVMKSRDHLVFLEATELLKVVGVALRPPPEKKLPPVIEKLAPKKVEAVAEKIPELPLDVLSEELDKAGVRPEEKPLMLQQIKELGPEDRREFIQSLIGEDRYKEIVEKLKLK